MNKWKNAYVRLSKVSVPKDPEFPTVNWSRHNEGRLNPGTSLPFDYWVEGTLLTSIVIGNGLIIDRQVRNGTEIRGVLQTSPIKEVRQIGNDSLRIETRNSVYILSKAPSEEYQQSGEANGMP